MSSKRASKNMKRERVSWGDIDILKKLFSVDVILLWINYNFLFKPFYYMHKNLEN